MNPETFFEELESQFVDTNHCHKLRKHFAGCNRLSLRVAGNEFSLVAPILGHDFVVGFCEKRAAWMCLGKNKVSLLRFVTDVDSQLPKIRIRTNSFSDFIVELKPPFAAEIKPSGEPSFVAALTGADHGLVYFKLPGLNQPNSAMGLENLDWLMLVESQDSSALEEWRDR
jgi:hypothetical protein